MNKEQAEHNESVCQMLYSNGSCNDWVVTTAFYSAMHFVYSVLFPLTINGFIYQTFHLYHISLPRQNRPNKHRLTLTLVETHRPEMYIQYRWLFDSSMNARYRNYRVSQGLSDTAKSYLTWIKSKCYPT